MERTYLSSGQLARETGVGVETLRFYERRGILPRPERTPSGHRRYRAEVVNVLRLVQQAKTLGFTLAEIAGLLSLRGKPTATCNDVCAMVRARLDHVEQQLATLRAQRARLKRLKNACPRVRPLRECPLVVELETVRPTRRRER